jgi:arsenite/tail-anchored protein-transporting ATPase
MWTALILFLIFLKLDVVDGFAYQCFSSSHRSLPNGCHRLDDSRTLRFSWNFRLFSFNPLIEFLEKQSLVSSKKNQQTILVGGKGGVGKTTISAALAVELAATHPEWNVLIVSTDPAHSLGDALDIQKELSRANGKPYLLDDPVVTQGRLYAQEVNADIALREFRESMSSAMDVQQLASTLSISPEILESIGVQELQGIIQNPPPGLDELVALSNIFAASDTEGPSDFPFFDIVVVDTAPTGHTLRLLALPQFLSGLLGKLIQLRLKLSRLASTLQAMFGSEAQQERKNVVDLAMNRLENFQKKVSNLRSTLQDQDMTRFIVVTVPTQLAVAESKRLMSELQHQSISVSDLVINQCVVKTTEDYQHENGSALMSYFNRRVAGQQKWIQALSEAVAKVSQSSEYQANIGNSPVPNDFGSTNLANTIAVTQVPFFDVELVGIPALGYVGSLVFMNNPNFAHLFVSASQNERAPPKVVICGGKGGVGKTTSSSSLAVSMAVAGHKVALISTDPAHSLGDAVAMNLSGGTLQECLLIGVPGMTESDAVGSLSVLEIDPTASISQFKGVVDQLMGSSNSDTAVGISNDDLRTTLKDLQDVFDTLPAGTDEVIALAKIVNIVKKGGFDRIVLDTAPTGHTLRMLSTPGFLADLIDRLLRISDQINSNAVVQMLLLGSTSATRREEIKTAVEAAKSTLLSFQLQMYDLEDLFANAQQTEFMIVTIPTELATRESIRLLNDLTFDSPDTPIKVRNVIVNQVLRTDSSNEDIEAFLTKIKSSQSSAINDVRQYVKTNVAAIKNPLILTEVPYLDTEPRGVFGLQALASELTRTTAPQVDAINVK